MSFTINKAYKNKTNAAQLKSELDRLAVEQNNISKKREDISNKTALCIERCVKLANEKSNCENEKEKYAAYTEGNIVLGEIEQLVREYDNLHSEYSEKMFRCVEECKKLQSRIDEYTEDIRQNWPELELDDYKTEYDHSRLQYLQSQFENCSEALLKAESDYRSQKIMHDAYKRDLDKCKKKLGVRGYAEPLSEKEIFGNYEKRIEDCNKEKTAAESSQRETEKRLSQLNFDRNKIETRFYACGVSRLRGR